MLLTATARDSSANADEKRHSTSSSFSIHLSFSSSSFFFLFKRRHYTHSLHPGRLYNDHAHLTPLASPQEKGPGRNDGDWFKSKTHLFFSPTDCWLFCFLFLFSPLPPRRVNALNGSSTRDQPLIQSHENSSFFVFFCLGAHKRKRIRVFESMQGNARQGKAAKELIIYDSSPTPICLS